MSYKSQQNINYVQCENQDNMAISERGGAFEKFHPAVIFLYFIFVLIFTMFQTNPVIISLSLVSALLFFATLTSASKVMNSLKIYLPIFLLIVAVNPIFSHNGQTVLFKIGSLPFSLESFLYGANIGAMLLAVVFWCKSYSIVFTSEKFRYLFARAIPQLTLVITMAVSFIPRFKRRLKDVEEYQKSVGIYEEKGYIQRVKSAGKVFVSVLAWSLEGNIDTANSMKARGYGAKGDAHSRTNFGLYPFRLQDVAMIVATCVLAVTITVCSAVFTIHFSFYPVYGKISATPAALLVYLCFCILTLLPFIIEVLEKIRWKFCVGKI